MQVEETVIWEERKKETETSEFRYSMTITIRPLVAQPIKMQHLH